MTSTIWTLGGGAAAADTFLLPHPPDDRRVKTTKPRRHSNVAKFRPSFVEGPTRDLYACHRFRMASSSRLWSLWSKGAPGGGGAPVHPNQRLHRSSEWVSSPCSSP